MLPCAQGYGRIVRGSGGELIKIVEEQDASGGEKKINEVNTSVYCFQVKALRNVLSGLSLITLRGIISDRRSGIIKRCRNAHRNSAGGGLP